MLHTGNIEAGHDLKEEELAKLQHDKEDRNLFLLSTAILSIIRFIIEICLIHVN
jgi:hypothetical protein